MAYMMSHLVSSVAQLDKGVRERLDESIVALQMILGLDTVDVLHLR